MQYCIHQIYAHLTLKSMIYYNFNEVSYINYIIVMLNHSHQLSLRFQT